MSIHRAPRPADNFTIIRNVVFSAGLSLEGVGLLTYLLSKPDNWNVSKTQLRETFGVGRDKIDKILKELVDSKFVSVKRSRGQGRYIKAEYTVFDMPITDSPDPEKPGTVEPHLISTDIKQELKETKNICTKPKNRVSYPDDFSQFWEGYLTDPNMSKRKAYDEWKKLGDDQRACAISALPGFRAYCKENDWYRPVHALRFLKEERFMGFLDGHANKEARLAELNARLQGGDPGARCEGEELHSSGTGFHGSKTDQHRF